ncbi:MAG: 2-phospho-L-lactate guanylyltransferase [Acidimicrobiia bacterium]|nr:2-phospho-L-lactate guanylyltransferase [Acidimicrobiia bacterium]
MDEAASTGRAATAVVIPVKSFEVAKGRLADTLDAEARTTLARRMAGAVVAAAAPLSAWVVCEDHDVAAWALSRGAGVIWREAPGLNAAVTAAVEFLAADGYRRAIIAHGDLPLASELEWVGDFGGVTIVPDRRGDGTNVLSVPTAAGFVFAYGPGSAAKHRAEAERLGLPIRVAEDERLGWDVDTPDDLAVFDEGRS